MWAIWFLFRSWVFYLLWKYDSSLEIYPSPILEHELQERANVQLEISIRQVIIYERSLWIIFPVHKSHHQGWKMSNLPWNPCNYIGNTTVFPSIAVKFMELGERYLRMLLIAASNICLSATSPFPSLGVKEGNICSTSLHHSSSFSSSYLKLWRA